MRINIGIGLKRSMVEKYDPLSEKKWRNFVTVAIQRMGLSYLYVKGVMMLDGYRINVRGGSAQLALLGKPRNGVGCSNTKYFKSIIAILS